MNYVLMIFLSVILVGCSSSATQKEYSIRRIENLRDIRDVVSKDSTLTIKQKGYYISQADPTKKPTAVLEKDATKSPIKSAVGGNIEVAVNAADISPTVVQFPKSGMLNIATGSQVEAIGDMVMLSNDNILLAMDSIKNDILNNQKKISQSIGETKEVYDNSSKKLSREIIEANLASSKEIRSELNKVSSGISTINYEISQLKLQSDVLYENTVFFDKNKIMLSKDEKKRLTDFLDKTLMENKDRKKLYIAVIGSASTKKTEHESYFISEERVKDVVAFIKKIFVNVDYEISKSYGIGDTKAKTINSDRSVSMFDHVLVVISNNKNRLNYLPSPIQAPINSQAVKSKSTAIIDDEIRRLEAEDPEAAKMAKDALKKNEASSGAITPKVEKKETTQMPAVTIQPKVNPPAQKGSSSTKIDKDMDALIKEGFPNKERNPINTQTFPLTEPVIKRDKPNAPFGSVPLPPKEGR